MTVLPMVVSYVWITPSDWVMPISEFWMPVREVWMVVSVCDRPVIIVPSAELKVPIIGGIEVTNSTLSATIIDLRPTVFNIGSALTPEFIIQPVAKTFAVPSSGLTRAAEHRGSGSAWRASRGGRTCRRTAPQTFR